MRGLTVDDLLAREEIGDVVKNLARGTDRLDAELMASCYHPDGTDDHNVFRGTGSEFARWVVDTLPHFEATMHFIGSPRVRRDGDRAAVDTSFLVDSASPSRPPGTAPLHLRLRRAPRRTRNRHSLSPPACARSTGVIPWPSIPREDSGSKRAGPSVPATARTSRTPISRNQVS